MFGFGVSKDLTQLPVSYGNEEELEEGFDLHSKNLFGASEINWVVGDNDQQVRKRNTTTGVGMLHFEAPITPEQKVKQELEVEESKQQEEVQDDISESSFEDLEVEKADLKELHVGMVRNFTDKDVMLTVLDDKFKGGDLFQSSDQFVLKKDQAEGVDLSKEIRFYESPFLQMLFGLQQQDSAYKYIVFAEGDQFYVKKYRRANIESDAEDGSLMVSSDNLEIPGAVLVQEYSLGNEQNRNINIEMFLLYASEF